MKTTPQILGKEPAAWVGLIESALTLLLAFGIGITQTSYAPWVALFVALGGVYTAWATKDTMLGVIVGLAKALIVLVAVYGLTLTDSQTASIIGVVTLLVGFFQRTQTSPDMALVKPDGHPYITGP